VLRSWLVEVLRTAFLAPQATIIPQFSLAPQPNANSLTSLDMVGNLNKKCKLCKGTITHGNTERHNIGHHAEQLSKSVSTAPATSFELRSTLSEVLESCGIPQELWPSERKVLDRLQSYRLLEDRTTAFDMPGEPRLQIIDDTSLGQALPPLEELIARVAVATGTSGVRYEKFPGT
jgi:hypothetical protein